MRLLEALGSLRLSLWLLLAELALLALGAVMMPLEPELYGRMNAVALFDWMLRSPVLYSWWLWGAVLVLALLALNTVVCSLQALRRKREPLALAPQVMHLGFLLVLLAHLVGGYASERGMAVLREGMSLAFPAGTLKVKGLRFERSPEGFVTGWQLRVGFSGAEGAREAVLQPNRPAFYGGWGVYVRDLRPPLVLLQLSRDPSSAWALAGGVLFSLAAVALVALKLRQEG